MDAHRARIWRCADGFRPQGLLKMGGADFTASPVHEQCLDEPFWIDQFEVWQAQFRQFGGNVVLSSQYFGDRQPVENISREEASAFCALRGGQLPSKQEWEYAARGSGNWDYPLG